MIDGEEERAVLANYYHRMSATILLGGAATPKVTKPTDWSFDQLIKEWCVEESE
jgi:hypothetical protein